MINVLNKNTLNSIFFIKTIDINKKVLYIYFDICEEKSIYYKHDDSTY